MTNVCALFYSNKQSFNIENPIIPVFSEITHVIIRKQTQNLFLNETNIQL